MGNDCSQQPCQSKCCPNPPGTSDPKSSCATCRMAGYDNDCNTDGQHVWCNKKRCWTADQVTDPSFWPWGLCGLNGADPPETIVKQWCGLPAQQGNWYCKTLLQNPVQCTPQATWYECAFGKLLGVWLMFQNLFGNIMGGACDSISKLLPDWAQFLTKPVCWLAGHPMVVAVIVGVIVIGAVLQPVVNLALLAK